MTHILKRSPCVETKVADVQRRQKGTKEKEVSTKGNQDTIVGPEMFNS